MIFFYTLNNILYYYNNLYERIIYFIDHAKTYVTFLFSDLENEHVKQNWLEVRSWRPGIRPGARGLHHT